MEILAKRELEMRKVEILEKIRNGAIFIYPTDTIYGIGCSALDEKAVQRIREIKQRPNSPFSICVPSLEWINKNCHLNEQQFQIVKDKLPGPYTVISQLKNKNIIANNVNPKDNSIGKRLLNNFFQQVIQDLDFPIVTTSANKHGEPFMTDLNTLDPDIKEQVEFLIYDGEKEARPSKIINLVTNETIER